MLSQDRVESESEPPTTKRSKKNVKDSSQSDSQPDVLTAKEHRALFTEMFNRMSSMEDKLLSSVQEVNKRVDSVELAVKQTNGVLTHHEKELEKIRVELRRLNLIFVGVREEIGEDIAAVVKNLIDTELELDSDIIPIDTVFRFGVPRSNAPRNIKVKFACETARSKVWNVRDKLITKKTGIFVNEDLPPITLERRRLLRLEARKAKDLGHSTKLMGDRIMIDRLTYELDDSGTLVQFSRQHNHNHISNHATRRNGPLPSTHSGFLNGSSQSGFRKPPFRSTSSARMTLEGDVMDTTVETLRNTQ